MTLIVSDEEGNEIVTQSEYENEAEMQEYIENNPESIPLYQINDDLQISVAVREFTVQGEFIDALAFDQQGGIYIIETKLASNTDKRQVIAQAFDYGASLWDSQHPNRFITNLDNQIEGSSTFKEWVRDELGVDEDYEEFQDSLFENLETGRFAYVIVMDEVSDRLKNLIKYLTANSLFDLYGVELDYYKHEGDTIVVPNLYGTEVKKNTSSRKTSNRKTYAERGKFFDAVQQKFDDLLGDEAENVEYTDGNRYRQIRFDGIHNQIHLEWNTNEVDKERCVSVRLDFEVPNAAEENKRMLSYFKENRFEEIKEKLGVDDIQTSSGKAWTKFYVYRSLPEDGLENEELRQWAAEKMAVLYRIVKDDIHDITE